MIFGNLIRTIFKKPEPPKGPEKSPFATVVIPAPGEIKVDRNWTDDPNTDTTIIVIGGQVESKALLAIKEILSGQAHISHYGKKRTKAKLVGLTGIGGGAVIWFLIAMFLFFGTVGILAAGDLWKHLGLSPRDFYDEISFWLLVLAVGVCAWAAELMWRLK